MKIAILDANEQAAPEYRGIVASLIGQWLEWEVKQADLALSPVEEADIVFLAFAGSVGWKAECSKALKRHRIEPDAERRACLPYVIAGGPVDSVPLTALSVADALVVGEGYRIVRDLLHLIKTGQPVSAVVDLFRSSPHAIERSQVRGLVRDRQRPWLLANPPAAPLATPDPEVDWTIPPIKPDDKVVRLMGSKGCHFKCAYCATTYRQTYRINPDGDGIQAQAKALSAHGERVQIVSNDPANIPWYTNIHSALDHGSYTIEEFLKPKNRAAILEQRPRIVRFGVEGLSERIRWAWHKPIPNPTLLEVLADLRNNGIKSHMFMIVGAPYETDADWDAWRVFFRQLAIEQTKSLCRIKYTTYQATAPAPLMRFVAGNAWEARAARFHEWYFKNSASAHLLQVKSRGSKVLVTDIADQLQVTEAVSARLVLQPDTTNLAPTVEDFSRMPSNALIGWPLSVSSRFKMGETYLDRMNRDRALPAMATLRRSL